MARPPSARTGPPTTPFLDRGKAVATVASWAALEVISTAAKKAAQKLLCSCVMWHLMAAYLASGSHGRTCYGSSSSARTATRDSRGSTVACVANVFVSRVIKDFDCAWGEETGCPLFIFSCLFSLSLEPRTEEVLGRLAKVRRETRFAGGAPLLNSK